MLEQPTTERSGQQAAKAGVMQEEAPLNRRLRQTRSMGRPLFFDDKRGSEHEDPEESKRQGALAKGGSRGGLSRASRYRVRVVSLEYYPSLPVRHSQAGQRTVYTLQRPTQRDST